MEETTATVEPTLEQLRDEKCIPVARAVLNDMAVEMMPKDALKANEDFMGIVMKCLQRTLDADLNVTTENPYVFQLLLGALSGLSSAVQQSTTIPIDDTRYSAIAKKMLGILATANITLGNVAPEKVTEEFKPVIEQLNTLFAAEKLTWLEVKYITEAIFGAFKLTQQIFSNNVEKSVQTMEARILGIEDMTDLSMKKLDATLKDTTLNVPSGNTTAPAAGTD